MKNKFTITAFMFMLLSVLTFIPVIGFAADGEIEEEGEASVSVGASNSNSFKVSIPIHDYDHDFYLDCYNRFGYIPADASYCGDLASDQYIDIQIDKNTSFNEVTGTKQAVNTITNFTFNSNISISSGYDLQNDAVYTKNVMVRTKKLSAGDWKCPVHYTISIKNVPIYLTEENILNIANNNTAVSELTIPGTIVLNGKTYDVGGIQPKALKQFTNLTTLNLEKSNAEWYYLYYGWWSSIGKTNDLIINCNGNNMYLEQVPRSTQFHYLNTGECIISGNPFGGENDSTYAEVTDFDWSKVIAVTTDCPIPMEEYTMSPNTIKYYNGLINATKINVPYLETCCDSIKFSGNTEEIYFDNDIVSSSCFSNMTNLKKVTLGPNVRTIREDAFSGCTSLTEIVIPETVTNIATSAFTSTPFLDNLKKNVEKVYINGIYICKGDKAAAEDVYTVAKDASIINSSDIENETKISFASDRTDNANLVSFNGIFSTIKTIDFSNVKRFNPFSNSQFPALTKVILGNSNISIENSAFANMGSLTDIELNEGLEYIGNFAFNHCSGYEKEYITIPASVKAIGSTSGNRMCNHTFYDFGKENVFNEFRVADGSEYFTAVDGVLYTKDMTTLIAVPKAKVYEDGIMTLPDETINLSELSFSRNTSIKELVLGDNIQIHFSQDELNNESYTALNIGNSLSCAVYEFTNIEKYTVKDTNPNYNSIDGVIYSKDMKKLIAVPHNYQGILNIPEGVEEWCENAIWLNYDSGHGVNEGITSISIPSTMKIIDEKQLAYIKSLGTNKVSIAAGNTVYMMYYNYGAYDNGIHVMSIWNEPETYKLTGKTGYPWVSGSDGRVGNSDDAGSSQSLQNFEFISLGAGTYTVTWNTELPVYWKAILVRSDGTGNWSKTNSPNSTYSGFTTEKSYTFTVEDNMNILTIGVGILADENNTASNKTNLTNDEKSALVSALTITKVE